MSLPKVPPVIRNKLTGRFERNPDVQTPVLSDANANENVNTTAKIIRDPTTGRFVKNPNYKPNHSNPNRNLAQYNKTAPSATGSEAAPDPNGAPPSAPSQPQVNPLSSVWNDPSKLAQNSVNQFYTLSQIERAVNKIAATSDLTLTAIRDQSTLMHLGFNQVADAVNRLTTVVSKIRIQPIVRARPQVARPEARNVVGTVDSTKDEPSLLQRSGLLKAVVGIGVILAAVNNKFVQIGAQIVALTQIAGKIWDSLKQITILAKTQLLKIVDGILSYFKSGSPLVTVLEVIWNDIKTIASVIKNKFSSIFKSISAGIAGTIDLLGEWFGKIAHAFSASGAIGKTLKAIGTLIGAIVETFRLLLKPLTMIVQWAGKLLSFIPGLNVILSLLSLKMKDITDVFEEVYDSLKDIFDGKILTGLKKAILAIDKFVIRIIGRFVQDLLDLLGFEETARKLEKFLDELDMQRLFADIAKFFTEDIPNIIKGWYNDAVDWAKRSIVQPLSNALDWVKNTFNNVYDKIKETISNTTDWITNNIIKPINDFGSSTSIKDFFTELFQDPAKKFEQLAGFNPVDAVVNWIHNTQKWIEDKFQSATQSIGSEILNIGGVINGLYDDIKKSIINMFPDKTILGVNPRKTVESVLGTTEAVKASPVSAPELNSSTNRLAEQSALMKMKPTVIIQNNNNSSAPVNNTVISNGGGARYQTPPTTYADPSQIKTYAVN